MSMSSVTFTCSQSRDIVKCFKNLEDAISRNCQNGKPKHVSKNVNCQLRYQLKSAMVADLLIMLKNTNHCKIVQYVRKKYFPYIYSVIKI